MLKAVPGQQLDDVLAFLERRRSVPLNQFRDPGPDEAQLRRLLTIAVRAPDHGKLEPWRFIVYDRAAGEKIGEALAELAQKRNPAMREDEIDKERNRLCRAPVAIGIVSTAQEHDRIPVWEQFLSAGAVAMNLVSAATAHGFAVNWVTGWFSDDAEGRALVGLAPHERLAGIIHIGSHDIAVPDRPRPDVEALISGYAGPYTADHG